MNKELNITEEEYKEINAENDNSIRINTKNLGRVSLKISKNCIIQKKSILLNKIFQTDKKSNSNKKPPQYSLIKSREELEKEHEIKVLENFLQKKLTKDYIDKISILLYNSKTKTNYPQKRNNIQKTIYKYDDNNELYLTLPKLQDNNKNKNHFEGKNYMKTDTTDCTTNNKITKNHSPKKFKEEDILEENIKEILYDNENIEQNEEDKAKILYEKLKTRYDSFDFENNNFNYLEDKKTYKSLPKIRKKQIPPEYRLIATPQQISEFDYNLGKFFVNGNLKYLTREQKEKLAYIAELNIFNSVDRMKEKRNILKEIKSESQNKKKIFMPTDFFKYDAVKWEKIAKERNKNMNNIAIHQLNDENREKLINMRDYINKLNVDAFVADKEVNKTISNINNFLTKYGIDANNSRRDSNSSNKSILKFQKNPKNERKRNDEKKE